MTKVGEAGEPHEASQATYHKQLQDSIIRFEFALQEYQKADNSEESRHLELIMNQQMALIRSAIDEIKRSGIHKQGEVVIDDYEHYKNNPTSQNLTSTATRYLYIERIQFLAQFPRPREMNSSCAQLNLIDQSMGIVEGKTFCLDFVVGNPFISSSPATGFLIPSNGGQAQFLRNLVI